jgi:hypothetical protein
MVSIFPQTGVDGQLLTSIKIFVNLTADFTLHVRRLSEREIRRHAPVPDFGCGQGLVEGIGLSETLDHSRVCGRDNNATVAVVRVRSAVWLGSRARFLWRGFLHW